MICTGNAVLTNANLKEFLFRKVKAGVMIARSSRARLLPSLVGTRGAGAGSLVAGGFPRSQEQAGLSVAHGWRQAWPRTSRQLWEGYSGPWQIWASNMFLPKNPLCGTKALAVGKEEGALEDPPPGPSQVCGISFSAILPSVHAARLPCLCPTEHSVIPGGRFPAERTSGRGRGTIRAGALSVCPPVRAMHGMFSSCSSSVIQARRAAPRVGGMGLSPRGRALGQTAARPFPSSDQTACLSMELPDSPALHSSPLAHPPSRAPSRRSLSADIFPVAVAPVLHESRNSPGSRAASFAASLY